MQPPERYELLGMIASGDFATVYRARDRELGREVAVKQIHPHFLHDERQLARYWQEAQLLATLQHPNIVTIYDIVRSRGWLILELMRGNLHQLSRGEPVDLDFLRLSMAGMLQGLQFLHTNGVIHGDVKPTNMLVDAQGHVKLGDFGLARRASTEGGSLLKGTTKYMAPELLSNQFGPVGPASDLYSLGFSAYELMCGSQFETLFPGLGTFGRDRQIAWMMWHAAPDRQLPEIGRVLEGVPPDLAGVVQKLVQKDPSRRYQSAKEALRDLRVDPTAAPPPLMEEDPAKIEAEAAAARKKKRLRLLAIGAIAFSLMLSVAMLLPSRSTKDANAIPEPIQGKVTRFYENERVLSLIDAKTQKPLELTITPRDRFYVNKAERSIREIRPDDHVEVVFAIEPERGRLKKIYASRAEMAKGRIKELAPEKGEMLVGVDRLDGNSEESLFYVPPDLTITFNGQGGNNGQPVQLADLSADDRVVVHYIGAEEGRKVTELAVERVVELEGVVRDIDVAKGELTLATGSDDATLVRLTFAPNAQVLINSRDNAGGQLFKPQDLQPGDKATVSHDSRIVRISAYRVLGEAGVIRAVHYDARTIDVDRDGGGSTTYLVGPNCQISIGGEDAGLDELLAGDRVDITHDTPGATSPQALSIAANRPADSSRWAVLIANQNYEDRTLTPLTHTLADTRRLHDALVARYKVPSEQTMLFADESLVRLRQAIPERLGSIPDGAKLVVYLAGHAYKDDRTAPGEPTIYFAPKNFELAKIEATGLPLQWIVDELEKCAAKEKLLLLDCTQPGSGPDLASQPSAAEMIRALRPHENRALLRTVTAIASTREGQRGGLLQEPAASAGPHGAFGWSLAAAFEGEADKNRDGRLEPTELQGYLTGVVPKRSSQNPELFLPDDRPPRLSAEAKQAIRSLAAFLRLDRPDIDSARTRFQEAERLADKEVEPDLLLAMVVMKARDRDEALKLFEEIKLEHPELLIPRMGAVWTRLDKGQHRDALGELAQMIESIEKPLDPNGTYPTEVLRAFQWAGQLREYAGGAVPKPYTPTDEMLAAVDAAVGKHDAAAMAAYEEGRKRTRAKLNEFDRRIATETDEATSKKYAIDRRQLVHYASFPYDQITAEIIAGMDQ
ncbi:MAG: protein kinase domain-containing protein [Planctomycetota bacterium]